MPDRPAVPVPPPPTATRQHIDPGITAAAADTTEAQQPSQAPPAATAETAAGETAPPPTEGDLTPPEATTDQSSLEGGSDAPDDHDAYAQATAEGEGMIAPPEPSPEVQLTYDRIVAAVKRQIVDVDGVPEAEFARDLPIPAEARERLVKAVGLELFGIEPTIAPNDPEMVRFTTVGALLDRLCEELPEHPINSGAGS